MRPSDDEVPGDAERAVRSSCCSADRSRSTSTPTRNNDAVGRVEHDELVVALRRRDMPLVAHARARALRLVMQGDAILHEQRHGPLVDETPPLAERDGEGVGGSGQERRNAREVELAGAFGEVVVDEVPILAAEPDRMPAARAAQRVGEHVQRVVPALRKSCRAAEIEVACDDHLRQPDRTSDAVGDADIDRIERRAPETCRPSRRSRPNRASFRRPCAEHVRFVDGQHARRGSRDVPEAGNAGALRARLDRVSRWRSVEHLEAIAAARRCAGRSAVQRSESTTAAAEPTNRGVPSASTTFARGISGINRRMTGSVAAARCASLSTRLFMSMPCRCLKPS